MPCTNKTLNALALIFICMSSFAHAESLTIDSAIEQAKQKKILGVAAPSKNEAETAPVATALSTSAVPSKDDPNELPKLWSIKGAGNRLTAEILDNGTVHSIELEKNKMVGLWTVIDFDSESVTLAQRTKIKKNAQKGKADSSIPQQLKLTVSPSGSSILKFNIPAEGEINTIQRQAASNLPIKPNPK